MISGKRFGGGDMEVMMEEAFGDLGVFEGSMEGITEGAFLTLRLELLEGNIVGALVAAVMKPSVSGYLSCSI